LRSYCEKAKKYLSSQKSSEIDIENLAEGEDLIMKISQEK